MEVVDPIVSIVAAENVDAASVHHSGVPVPRRGWLRAPVGIELTPSVRGEVEAEKVIASVGSVVPSKDVKIVVNSHASVQRSGTGRVHFVLMT